ncbi:MAG TPA: hypothetical protein VN253_17610 [Kofleriaceae bacterium]|nr:hypothetical protein [Kofleriaceae bacterium]
MSKNAMRTSIPVALTPASPTPTVTPAPAEPSVAAPATPPNRDTQDTVTLGATAWF